MFTTENTSGYSATDLSLLNDELADRLATIRTDDDPSLRHQIEQAFADEVGHGWLENRKL